MSQAPLANSKFAIFRLNRFFLVIFLQCFLVPSAFSLDVSQPEIRSAAHCDTKEDYEKSKRGTFGVTGLDLDVQGQSLIIIAKVAANRCKQLGEDSYKWERVDIHKGFEFVHEYFDFQEDRFKVRNTRMEYDKLWLTAINRVPERVGTGKVTGSKAKGYFARITVPLDKIATPAELAALDKGQQQSLRVSVFVKALMRYVSDVGTTPYEESSGLGLYDIDFKISKANGVLKLQR